MTKSERVAEILQGYSDDEAGFKPELVKEIFSEDELIDLTTAVDEDPDFERDSTTDLVSAAYHKYLEEEG